MSSLVEPSTPRLRSRLGAGWGWAVGVAGLAFAVRLVAVLRGGGLFGRIGYDGSVYYASAAALAHGLLPYRDFLLLHPPGIVLALLPFAALGRVVGDPAAYALARLAWFGLGAVSTLLVFAIVRSRGLWPAVVAALFYALFVPAIVSEHTTSLEAVGSVCLLAALALLTVGGDPRARPAGALLAAGALVGVATGTKIWGVAVVLALVGWSARALGVRRAGLVLLGALAGTVTICLPFFLAAPGPMWRMVVLDQLGRPRVAGSVARRLVDVLGLSELRGSVSTTGLTAVAVAVLAVLVLLAVRDPLGRLALLLLAVTGAVLLSTPPWSVAYTGLATPAVAVVVGTATARLRELLGLYGRLRVAAAMAAVATLAAYAVVSLPGLTFGTHFPGRSLERVLARAPGCVTTDDPIALIETGALRRNAQRRCPVVVDASGYSYDLRPGAGRHVSRADNPQWQRFVLDHLAGGETAVVVRFRTAAGLSHRTKAAVARWPVLADVGGYLVRQPVARAAPSR